MPGSPILVAADHQPTTRATTAERVARRRRTIELLLLLLGSALVGLGLWEVTTVQSATVTLRGAEVPAEEVEAALAGRGEPLSLLHLNRYTRPEDLRPFLAPVATDTADLTVIVEAAHRYITSGSTRRRLENVGELAKVMNAAPRSFPVQPEARLGTGVPAVEPLADSTDAALIRSRVTNLDGDGLKGIVVTLYTPDGDSIAHQTDGGGRYTFETLQPGATYRIRPHFRGFAFEGRGSRAPVLEVQPGQSVTFVGARHPTAQLAARLSRVKPDLVVRSPSEFRARLGWSVLVFFLAFYGVHALWRYGPAVLGRARLTGDPYLLPIMQVLAGLGLIMMISVRDPLRDQALFESFVQGVAGGCAALAVCGLLDVQRWLRPRPLRLPLTGRTLSRSVVLWLPFALALGLFLLLITVGHGPEGSDAKVNVGFFQPSEAIKVLVVLGLAGLLARYHDRLLTLHQRHIDLMGRRWRITGLALPRGRDVVLLLGVIALTLVMFVLQSDVGPALILAATALAIYGVARRQFVVPLVGFLAIVGGFVVIHQFKPAGLVGQTAITRLEMLVHPWDNHLTNGVQLAEAHWALATGGVRGLGLGHGSPGLIPAAHTDMILAAVGEELGLIGLIGVLLLYGALIGRGFRATLAADGPFAFFLGLGLTLLIAFQLVLIGGGVFGLLPLSGVVSPFLSFGRTSLIMNGLIVGLLAGISAHGIVGRENEQTAAYRAPVAVLGVVLGLIGLGYAARLVDLQLLRADELATRPALIRLGDGDRAFDQNNRIFEAIRRIPRGTIRDRNGLILAANDCADILAERDRYETAPFRVDVEALCAEPRARYYPLGAHTFYLLGDRETRLYQADGTRISALSFVEFDPETNRRLQGYDDEHEVVEILENPTDSTRVARDYRNFRELLPLMRAAGLQYPRDRSRFAPEARALLERDRDVRLSLDARLQVAGSRILAETTGRLRMNDPRHRLAAAVVVDARTGEVLAAVTHPLPLAAVEDPAAVEFDTEMRDRAFGWPMAPASTFKALLAMTALRRDPDASRRAYGCNRPGDTVRMETALIRSCNLYFQRLAGDVIGRGALDDALGVFEIGQGRTREGQPSSLSQLGIGQGALQASVADMAFVAAAVANDGARPSPTLLARTGPTPATPFIARDQAAWLGQALRRVVTQGTATSISGAPVPLAGKTGTGQYIVRGRRINRSWFIGFGPYGADRPLAIAVMIDAAGGGGRVAAPPAARILDAALSLSR